MATLAYRAPVVPSVQSRPVASGRGPLPSFVLGALTALALVGCGEAPVKITSPPSGAPPLVVGVIANTIAAGKAMGSEQDKVEALGVRWIREELDWSTVEPQPGVFTWSTFDRLLENAASRRLRVLPLLLGTPSWAGPKSLGLPDDPAAFAVFAAAAATRYGPGGSFGAFIPSWIERSPRSGSSSGTSRIRSPTPPAGWTRRATPRWWLTPPAPDAAQTRGRAG
jgi:Beta-galactosidase